jgi:hypothetical protein
MGYNPETGMYTPDKPPTVTPFGQTGGAFKELPKSAGTAFGQAGGNVGPITSTPVTAESQLVSEVSTQRQQLESLLAAAKKTGNKKGIADAQSALNDAKELEKLLKTLGSSGGAGVINPGNRSDAEYVSTSGTGTSSTGKNYINGKLATNEEWSKFLYGNSGSGSGGGAGAGTSTAAADALAKRQSAFDLLREQFAQYGLEGLVDPLKGLIQENVSPSEFAVRLRQTEPYKKRFAANSARIGKGLRALSEAEYITLEDSYQNIMRNYGLPATYYTKGDMGRQEGFEKFIAGDVSPAELEERVITAQNRVINAPPQVKDALKQFYPDINNSEILAYTLDPEKGLADIKRKITAAEIGGAAMGAGLASDVNRAEELARFGVTAERAREGYQAAVPLIERGSQLAGFYGESPYTQRTAEEELFGLTYAPESTAKRKRLTSLEQAQFAGQSGMTGGALSRDRAGSF